MNISTPPPTQQLSDVFLFACALLLSSVVSLYMLPSFILRRNVAGTSTLLWLFISNTLLGINYVIPSDVLLQAPIYCDITTKIFLGMQIAVPAGMLCFAMDLHYYIVICESSYQYDREKLARRLLHVLICVVVPLLYTGLHVIVQDHRFDIVKEFGCLPSAQFTFPAFIVIWFPLAFFAAAVLAYLRWHRRRLKYQCWLEGTESNWRRAQMELVMTYPVYSFREQKRLVTVEYIVGAWVLLLTASALILYAANGFVPYSRPQFSRVDVFDTLGNIPASLGPNHAMLWSGPVYTFLLFKYNSLTQFFRPYALLVEWAYRLSNRASFKEFEEYWRSILVEKGLLEKPPRIWHFYQKEEEQGRKFTAMPKRVERKFRALRAKAMAHELVDRLGPKRPHDPRNALRPCEPKNHRESIDSWVLVGNECVMEDYLLPSADLKSKPSTHEMPMPPVAPPPRPKRPDPSYQGWDQLDPRSVHRERRSGSRRKPSRREEVRRARKAVKVFRDEIPLPPLFPIPESPLVDMEVMAEALYGAVIPLTREEQAQLDRLNREYTAKLAEEKELASIRAEMRANRF